LVEGDNILGRDESAGVRIDVRGVSRRHARIRVRGEQATLEDLGSKNGTFLGGSPKRITTPVDLADGDVVHVGRILLVFRSSGEDGSTMTEGSRA
jgi:pSer/pThr/pTyr-binding forkhead associated (FHA) protein